MHDGPDEITTALAKLDGEINAIGARIRRLPDRLINARGHIDLVKDRRRLMSERDILIRRQCELALTN